MLYWIVKAKGMSLYTYRKNTVKIEEIDWSKLSEDDTRSRPLSSLSKVTGVTGRLMRGLPRWGVSALLASVGLFLILVQISPILNSYYKEYVANKLNVEIARPVPEDQVFANNGEIPYYDPGISYFQNLFQSSQTGEGSVAGVSTVPTDPVDSEYEGEFKLSIPSLSLEKVPVTANVDSYNERVYEQALKKGLAHFRGTHLPGMIGNSFIYGHSAVHSFFDRNPNYAETLFTKLEDIEVGDHVFIEFEGGTQTYVVYKKKIVSATDFSILTGIPGQSTITLMTCHPVGIGSDRLIALARKVS